MSASAKYILLVIFGLSLLPESAFSQSNGEPVFTAYSDAKEVLLNSYFEVTFTLKNGEGKEFTPPDFRDFKVLSGPSQGFQTSIRNGRMSQETSIGYRLQARRSGTLTIGPASIKVSGQTLRTEPLQIRVVRGQADPDEGTPEVFLVARLEQEEAFLGQQLVLDYILSSRVDVEALTAVSESNYEGFYSREIHQYDTRAIRELHNGVQYVSRILKRVVLYPQQNRDADHRSAQYCCRSTRSRTKATGFLFPAGATTCTCSFRNDTASNKSIATAASGEFLMESPATSLCGPA